MTFAFEILMAFHTVYGEWLTNEIFVQYQGYAARHILGGWRVCAFHTWEQLHGNGVWVNVRCMNRDTSMYFTKHRVENRAAATPRESKISVYLS